MCKEIWNKIANVSSIATLILFVFYFIGRWWSSNVEKKDLYEKIDIQSVDEEEDIDVININGNEIIKVESEKYLNWIKFYDAKWDGNEAIKTNIIK